MILDEWLDKKMKIIKFKNILGGIILILILLSGCGTYTDTSQGKTNLTDIPMASQELFAMDTYMTVTGYGEKCEEAVEAAVIEIQRLEALFSVGRESSEVSVLNRDGTAVLSEDIAVVIRQALDLYDSTDGAFDISVYPLMELWGFTTDNFKVPSSDVLKSTLEYVDASKIQYDAKTNVANLQPGQGIDLGGIAKGYTSDRIMQIFEEYDLVSGMVSLGGNVQCYLGKADGSPWRCGIQDPDDQDSLMCVVSVKDKAVITSGGYERYFTDEQTGKTWHHILDPKTGYSAESGLISVTIVSEKGMLADGLSTAVFIMGLDKSIDYWREHQDLFDMILVTEEREIYITEGISDSVSSDYPFNIIFAEE